MKAKYKATLKSHLYQENARVSPAGCSCLHFYNQGDDDAYVMGENRLKAGSSFQMNFDPGVEIEGDFDIRFCNKSENKEVVVTRVYFSEGLILNP